MAFFVGIKDMGYDKYVAPGYSKPAFTCPFCDVYSNFVWTKMLLSSKGQPESGLIVGSCSHCGEKTVWKAKGEALLWPSDISTAPLPNPDMPEDVKNDYMEARRVSGISPRGAAALLRLCIQKTCMHLGEKGKDLNTDIGNLVKKGLPVRIQQALDVVRVTGNNAVHPGEMQLEEDHETVAVLFQLVNMIVENQISQPKAVNDLYSKLPQKAVEAIEKRDGGKNT